GLLCYPVAGAAPIRAIVAASGVPTVLVFGTKPDPLLLSGVIEEDDAIRDALGHLARLGHRRIGVLAAGSPYVVGTRRSRFIRQVLVDLGLPAIPELLRTIRRPDGTERAVEELLALPHAPTAIITTSHRLITSCLLGLRR